MRERKRSLGPALVILGLAATIAATAIGISTLTAHDEGKPNVQALISQLTEAAESDQGIAYDRDDYHSKWRKSRDACDAREVVLLTEAVLISGIDKRCQPQHGAWLSWYDDKKVTSASLIDIDHMVPLAEAHISGAASWSASRKRDYANDLDLPAALAAVSRGSNRSKGAKDPASWMPPVQSAWCQYAQDWIAVKVKWGLSADSAEITALKQMLGTCDADYERIDEHPERLDFILGSATTTTSTGSTQQGSSMTPQTSTSTTDPDDGDDDGSGTDGAATADPEPETVTYESCAAAEAAGVQRQRGSKGNGRGFPAAVVPSARDGDGDGVVCER